ncbi:MAG: amino acid adenylation domain-containing protein [Vicinamibacterales bacterium]
MSSLSLLFDRLRAADVRVSLQDGRVAVSAPAGALTPELRAELAASRDALLVHLHRVEASRASAEAGVVAIPRSATMPLSHVQRRLWFLRQLDPANVSYNIPAAYRMRGRLDVTALQGALDDLAARHESLRTRFVDRDGEPSCAVEPSVAVPLERFDLSGRPEHAREDALAALLVELARRRFDPARAPLIHAFVIDLSDADCVFGFVVDHLVADGVSMAILIGDVRTLYGARLGHQVGELDPLPVQYLDYADWQRRWLEGGVLDEQLAFWRERLAPPLAVLDLAPDAHRPAHGSGNGGRVSVRVSREVTQALRDVSRREGTTLFMTLLAAFYVLLYRRTGSVDLPVGTAIANRSRPEVARVVGCFVNSLVMRGDVSGNPTLRELLVRVRGMAASAYAHQDAPFDRLVDALAPPRMTELAPLFQVMFVLHDVRAGRLDLGGTPGDAVEVRPGTARLDLTVDVFDYPDELAVFAEYSSDLFEAPQVEAMLREFEGVLATIPAGLDNPIGTLGAPEEQWPATVPEAVVRANDTERPVPDATVSTLVEEQAARTPDRPAVADERNTLTYRALEERATRIAHALRARGAGPGTRVGVGLPRTTDLVATLLAVMKTGAAYVPLDPLFPPARLAHMVADSGLAVLVAPGDAEWLSALPDGLEHVDPSQEDALSSDTTPMRSPSTGGDAAYVIYTSGSTGTPKGVVVPHGALTNFVLAMGERPGLEASDVLAAVTTISFDIAGLELYGPLVVGGRVEVVSRAAASGRAGAGGAAGGERNDGAAGDAGDVAAAAGGGVVGRGGFRALCGGEALPADVAAALLPRVGALWNLYGPTETTIWSTVGRVSADAAVTIGQPIANTRVYVVDAGGRRTPVGVPGEIWIGGAGVATGYHGQPALTAAGSGRTRLRQAAGCIARGDVGRWRADGTLEHLGRQDDQVKVRGFRIELGEIEHALRAVVGCGTRWWRCRRAGRATRSWWRMWWGQGCRRGPRCGRRCGRRCRSMVPAGLVPLAAIPLTPNGKVDRRALPAFDADADATRAGTAPATPTERALAAIWSDVLGLTQVHREDDFFALGGHSLIATRVASRVRDTLRPDFALRSVFDHPVLSALAAAIDESVPQSSHALSTLAPRTTDGPAPLSYAQERMWLLHELAPESAAYNIAAVIELTGVVDASALAQSVAVVVDRHPVLRMTVAMRDGRLEQQPGRAPSLAVESLPDDGRGEAVEARLAREANAPFDLGRGPVFRATLLRGDGRQWLVLVLHHIAGDQWSLGILGRELAAAYNAVRAGRAVALPALPLAYGDYAAWQRAAGVDAAAVAYWERQLAGAPALDLPTDHARPPVLGYRGALHTVPWPAGLRARLEARAQEQGATLFMVLLAGFVALLHRYTAQTDVVVGVPVADRPAAALEGVVGPFLNTLAVRTPCAGDAPFTTLLGTVRATLLDAYAHQQVPFEHLLTRLPLAREANRRPLVQVLFNFHSAPMGDFAFDGLEWSATVPRRDASQFELGVHVDPSGDGCVFVEYDTDLFAAATIEHLARQWLTLLEGVAANPGCLVSDLPVMSAIDVAALEAVNATDRAVPADTVATLIEQQVDRTPDRVAVSDASRALTYRELDRRANQVAAALRERAAGPGVLVALCVDRSVDLVVAVLAIMKTGAAYVPLDASLPPARVAFMASDSGCTLALGSAAAMEALSLPDGIEVVRIEEVPSDAPADRSPSPSTGGDAAYVIYTSGSTGTPKGVVVPHGALTNFVLAMGERPGLEASDVLAAVTTISFDIAGLELYGPLVVGGRVEVVSRAAASDGQALAGRLAASGATVLQATPATWRLLLEAGWSGGAGFRALCGGEALPADVAAALLPRVGALWNLYGPTETTIWSTVGRVSADAAVTIGQPIANTRVYVVDAGGRRTPVGVPGEIWIGGAGVATGYHGQPALTAARFGPDPFAAGGRVYRTGDVGRWRADGTLEHLGRQDDQVKVRGFRIELGEIEHALRAVAGVRDAVVAVQARGAGDAQLVAYVVGAGVPAWPEVRATLRATLPEYMVPAGLVPLAAIPLTPNGKVDRRALPAFDDVPRRTVTAPATDTERRLARIWQEVLDLDEIGREDDFFALGGHSLLAARAAVRVREALQPDFALRDLFSTPVLAALASAIDASGQVRPPSPQILPAPSDQEPLLSFAQERMWLLHELAPESAAYNVAVAAELTGPLDAAALHAAFDVIVERHGALRTAVSLVDGTPRPRLLPEGPVLEIEDLPNEGGDVDAAARKRMAQLAQQPFQVRQGPVFRATLLRGDGRQWLVLVLHHIAGDQWSLGILGRELAAAYACGACGRGGGAAGAAAGVRLRRGSGRRAWMRRRWRGRQLARGAGAGLADRTTRGRRCWGIGARCTVPWPAGLQARLEARAQEQGATLFMVLLAGFVGLLHR